MDTDARLDLLEGRLDDVVDMLTRIDERVETMLLLLTADRRLAPARR